MKHLKKGDKFNLNHRRLLPIEDHQILLKHSSTSTFDDNNMYVYQIYYDDLQLSSLSDDTIPYYNGDLTVYFENDIIRSLYSKIAGEYFGVLSWNFVVKNKIQFKTSYISGNHDIYLFDGTSIACNVLEYSQYYHPRFKEIFKEVLKNLNIDQGSITMSFGIFTNAVVARSSIYKEYMDNFLLPTMDFLDNLDGDLKEALWSDSNYEQTNIEIISKIFEHTGKPYYTYHAFICERLWSVFYELNKYKYSVKIISKLDVEINEL